MSTQEISKQLQLFKDILNSRYGWLGIAFLAFWGLGKLSPDETDKAIESLKAIVNILNNGVGVSVVSVVGLFGITTFIFRNFFTPYISEQKTYALTIQNFQNALDRFFANSGDCSQRLTNIEGGVVDVIERLSEHEVEVTKIVGVIENRFIPAMEQIAEKMSGV